MDAIFLINQLPGNIRNILLEYFWLLAPVFAVLILLTVLWLLSYSWTYRFREKWPLFISLLIIASHSLFFIPVIGQREDIMTWIFYSMVITLVLSFFGMGVARHGGFAQKTMVLSTILSAFMGLLGWGLFTVLLLKS